MDVRTFFVGCLFVLACVVPVLSSKAETVVQGVLQLQWADPPRALPGRVQKAPQLDAKAVRKNYIKAVGKGIMKVMSKMGISTYQSYCGAQIFDAVGLSSAFVDRYFTGTATTIEGVGLAEVAEEALRRHAIAYGHNPIYEHMLDVGGIYQFRLRGEDHAWTPTNISKLQHAVRGNAKDKYVAFAKAVNEETGRFSVRGQFRIKLAEEALGEGRVEEAAAAFQQALELEFPIQLTEFYTSYFGGGLKVRHDRGELELLMSWHQADFERLQQNIIAHILMKRRLKQRETVFIAATDHDDYLVSVLVATGEVYLEKVGMEVKELLAPDLATFLQQLSF